MPQYRSNQFVSDWLKPQAGEWQNAPFQYPRRVVRTSDFDNSGNRTFATKELDRGFMRGLLTETASPASGLVTQQTRQRFNFQFNPSAIQQEVQMRQDIYLPILQDPAQFAQPMSAVATFNFELLLDRTMEVGKGAGAARPGQDTNVLGESNPSVDVYQIGVLSDLQVLYSIIGQGFNSKFIMAQLEQMKTQAKLDAKYEENTETTQSDIDSITSSTFSDNANFGNNAFLIPMPVRVVFSELFMIDGFITSTSVRFTKFNTSMVPIQASIGISMNALYIGFAKENTFLTVQLENAKNIAITDAQTAIAQQTEITELARQAANQFVFYCDSANEWVDMFSSSNDNPVPIKAFSKYSTSVESNTNLNRQFKVGFKDAKRLGNNDPIETYYENGGTASFSYTWKLYIYGPYNTQANAQVDANGNKTRGASNFVSAFTGIKKVAEYSSSSNPVATDKTSWLRIRSDSIRDNDAEAKPTSGDYLSGEPSDYDNKYFLVHLFATVTAGGQTREVSTWKPVKGDQQFKHEATLGWPTSTGVGGNTSGISGSGYANDPPPPPGRVIPANILN